MLRKMYRNLGSILTVFTFFLVLSSPVFASSLKDPINENNNDWGFSDDGHTGTSDGEYVYGPDTPPAGTGSAMLSVGDSDGGEILGNLDLFRGIRLDRVTKLSYSTYRTSVDPANVLAIALQLNINLGDGGDADEVEARFVYEPYKSGNVVPSNAWQTWNTLADGNGQGNWWIYPMTSGANPNGYCPQSNACTWSEFLNHYPNATFSDQSTLNGRVGGLFFKAGSGWDYFEGYVDNLIVGIDSFETFFDFGSNAARVSTVAGVAPYTQNTGEKENTIWEGGNFEESFSSVSVSLDFPLYNPPGNTEHDDVTNPINYSLLLNNARNISIDQITYDDHGGAGPYDISIFFNQGNLLPNGDYLFTVEGDTSVVALDGTPIAGDGVHPGTDFLLHFTINVPDPKPAPASLPGTGFQHGRVTALPKQPVAKEYITTALTLSIPKLDLEMPIVGVPRNDTGWDVTWLNQSAGYLAGSAFPTWVGNTVLTGHVWDAYNRPGPFAKLKTLRYGDQVKIHAWGLTYTYEVRESKLVTAKNMSIAFQSEEYDWLTLLTCEFYNPFSGEYLFRRAVRAVLVDVR